MDIILFYIICLHNQKVWSLEYCCKDKYVTEIVQNNW